MSFKIFIQARMSSTRLPGKVLMPFHGKPIIQNVVDAAGIDKSVVLTSTEQSDDALVEYLKENNIAHFRGPLHDVYGRFCNAINHYNAEWVMRICADSPLIPTHLITAMENIKRDDADIITNVHPRSFPKGHSVEIIRARTMLNIPKDNLDDDDKEHVTRYFYQNSKNFKIISVTQPNNMSAQDLAIDTQNDYDRLSVMRKDDILYNPDEWKVSRP